MSDRASDWPFGQKRRDAQADEITPEAMASTLRALVAIAAGSGLVISIEQRPLQPLAMGHYESVVSVRRARGAA